jgi:phospholipase C
MASLDHIIVLMMENHSFDRMLGALLPQRPDGGGIKGTAGNNWNDDTSATAIPPIRHVMATTTTRLIQPDPMHDLSDVLKQIGDPNDPNRGYVTNYAATYPTTTRPQRQEIMGYYDDGGGDVVPNLHTLAKQYTICDRWFSSLPGPTFANRVFMHTGTSKGYTTNSPSNDWDQMSIYDLLGDNQISWGIYYGDMSSTVLLQPVPLFAYTMRHFWTLAKGPAANVPQYCFLEPNYGVYRKASENDQHPMSDVVAGDQFIRDVYNAIRANTQLWQSSLLVIIYDEHGGFYDHVPQPATVPPDNHRDGSGFNFDKLGVRAPAVLVSPWLDQGVISDTFDHTSVLKFLIEQFGLAKTLLGDRVADTTTNTFTKHLRKSLRSTYGLLPQTNQELIAVPDNLPPSDLQKTLIDLGQHLATQISDPTVRNTLTAQPTDPSPRAQGRLAVEQFEAFLTDRAKQRPVSIANMTGAVAAKPRKAKARKTTPHKTKARKAQPRKTKPRKAKGGKKSRPKK